MNERQGLICSERSGRTGCVNAQGRAVIPFVYEELTYFSDSGVALIRHPDQGWLYIDRRNQLIGKALLLDNIPDESFGGLARFQAPSGKIGYLDRERRVAIPAKYDAAYPFRNCTALVCIGCHHNRWSKDGPERAACTGKAFVIDESGKKLKEDSGVDWEGCEQK